MPFGPSGFNELTTTEIIDDINAILVDVFGSATNLNTSSPNGQFVNQLAQMAQQNQNFMVLLTSSLYNPEVAASVWLDALCAFNGIVRGAVSSSTVTCTCSGSAGTLIGAGVLIANTNGDTFANSADVTIGVGGTVSATFVATIPGPISVLAGTVNNIVNQVYGWDSVTNPLDGVIGLPEQSDNSLRAARSTLLARYGSASLKAIYSNIVALVPDTPQNVYVQQNDTGAPITVDGVTLIANSIYIVILGSTPADIAATIYNKKCPGVNQNGSTTYAYTDTPSGTVFTARWDVPTLTPVQVNISYPASGTYQPDFETQVKAAVVDNFNGTASNLPDLLAVGLNQRINVSRFVPSLLLVQNAWDIQAMTIEKVTGGTPAKDLLLPANELPTLIAANVIITYV